MGTEDVVKAPARRNWRQLFIGHRSAQALLAVLIGAATALVCVAFHFLIISWSAFMTSETDFAATASQRPNIWSPGPVWLIVVPAISGLVYGPIVHRWAPAARGIGIPEVMLAVRRRGGQIPRAVMFVKVFAAAITIGGGGSVGKEGPVVQAGATVGSLVGSFFQMPRRRLVILVSCGSAAGIAATFNAPLAAAVFVLEVILVEFNAEVFGMAVLASVSSAVVSRSIIGDAFVIDLPSDLVLESQTDLWAVALVGLVCTFGGLALSKTLYWLSDIFERLYRGPQWAQPALGGLILGVGLWLFPMLYGTSTQVQTSALVGEFAITTLMALAALKILFTSYTIAMGGSGGIFAPSLFIGAMLGSAIGLLLSNWTFSEPGLFGIIGMGAAFAGAARAPIAAVLIIVEMTGQYSLTLPLMLAVVIATFTSRFFTRHTIYTEKLVRRGEQIDDPVNMTLLGRNQARNLMGPVPGTVNAATSLEDAFKEMSAAEVTVLPVVDDEGVFIGCVSSLELASGRLRKPEPQRVRDLHLTTVSVDADTLPSIVMQRMLGSHVAGVPVLEDGRLVGWLSTEDLVERIYRQQRQAIAQREQETSWGSRWQEKRRKR
ncbi:MAG: chloride channel protein [Actinomycetaceae bacterium]|nr:chloride channel protein [Actinomycetaceae bacterium]